MADMTAVLEANRAAVEELIRVTGRSASVWSTPRAKGKWSPSQVVEHVARALEEGANVVAGRPSKFPTLPAFARPIVRALLFNRVLRQGRFPKAKTNRGMDPEMGPATADEGIARLREACAAFERACLASAAVSETLMTATFGPVATADYIRFTEIHTRHHCLQMPGASGTPEPGSAVPPVPA